MQFFCNLTRCASVKVWVSYVTWPASTNTPVISSLTVCIGSTVTRIYTFLISTSQGCYTFRICQAFIWLALYVRTAFVSRWTLTFGSMCIYCTKCLNTTLLKRTRILTFSLDACLVVRAFIVTFAASC